MRVLNVNSLLDQEAGGGTAERTLQMSRHLVRAGVDCAVLTLDLGLSERQMIKMPGVQVTALPCLNRRFLLPAPVSEKLDRLVGSVDVVHMMSHWSLLNVLVYQAVRRHAKPYVVSPAGALPIFGRSRAIKQTYNLLFGRRIIRDADRFIAITASEIPHYLAYGGEQNKVVVIPNGICADDFKARDDEGFRRRFGLPARPIILFLGRLNAIKGPDLLLQAYRLLGPAADDYQLVFGGPDGGMLAELERISRSAGLVSRVSFVGNLSGTDKSEAFHAASLLVIPSRQEAMSIVAVEAGMCGTPVLLTDQCGFDLVGAIGGGLVVPASTEGLLSGLRELLARPNDWPVMGERLRQLVVRDYLWDNLVGRFVALYQELIAQCRGKSEGNSRG